MNKKKYRPHYVALLIALISIWVLSGCGKDAAIETYKQNMEVYFEGLSTLNDRINAIDPNSDTDGSELLGYLDQLDTITSQMAELEVPEQFSLVDSLADEASDNMSQAVELYHELYSSEEYNQSLADGAYEYYSRANKRIGYIRSILQGDIPEELEITEDTDSTDGTDGSSDEGTMQFYGGGADETDTEEYQEETYEEGEDDSLQYVDVED